MMDNNLTPTSATHKKQEGVKKIATIQRNTATPQSIANTQVRKGGHARNFSEAHMLESANQVTPRSRSNEMNPI